MKKAYINWKLVLVLVLGCCAVGITVVGLRKFNRTQRAEQGLKKGLAAYEDKRWKDAASGLGQYLAVHQSDTEILLKYGHAQARIQPFRRQEYAQAVNAYRAVLRDDEGNLETAQALIDLYLQAQVPAEAELVASRFLEKKQDSQIVLRLATAQVMQRKFEQAAKLLTDLITANPTEIAAYELIAHIAQERPDLLAKTPQKWIDEAVANNPQKAQAYILRAGYLSRLGNQEGAMGALKQAAGCDLTDIDVRLSLAAAWLRLEAIDQAAEQLDAVFAADPKRPELWQLRAVLATKRQDSVLCAQTARDGMEQLGDNKAAFLPYAVDLFLQARDLPAARSAMEELSKLDFNPGLVCYLDGLLAEQDNDWPRAMGRWREAVIQGYTSESVYLKLAEAAMRLEDRTSAIETLRRYVARNNRAVASQLMLTRLLMESRRWNEASEYAAAVLRLDSQNAEARTLQSRCRIELLAGQAQSQGRVDELLTELIASADSLDNRLLAFRIALNRQDWSTAQRFLDGLKERFGRSLQVRMADAEFARRRTQNENAAAILEEAMAEFPNASEPVIMQAALLTEQEKVPQAITLLQNAASRMQGSDQRKVQLWLADLYRQTDQTQATIDLFLQMASQSPHDILVRRQLLALRRDDAEIAALQKWIDEIKAIEGEGGRLWKMEQTMLWMTRGVFERQYTPIVALMNENMTANPDDQQSLMLLAAAHEQAGNVRLAVSLYRDMLARHPGDIDLAIAAMGAMYRAGEYRQADQLLADLLAKGYSDPRLAQLELQGYLREGRLDTAETLLEKMVLRNARDSSAKMSLAMLRTRNGQYADAKTLIDELLAENPDAVAPQAALVDWHLRQNQREQAFAVCDAYLRQHESVDAYRLRCQVLIAMGEQEKAVEDIGRILAMANNNVDVYLNASELYVSAGLPDQALEAARQALMSRPDSFDAQKQTAILLLGRVQTQNEGMDLLEKALAQQPRDVPLRLRKASLLLGQGSTKAAEAVQILNALVNESPRLETAWGYLAEWYLFSNQPGMAMDTVLRGLATLPESRALLITKARVESLRSPAVALETLNQLARKFPADEGIMEMRVRLMQRLGKTSDAISLLRAAPTSESSQNAVRMKFLLMEMVYENGETAEAQQIFEQLSAEKESSGDAMLQWLRLIGKTAPAEQCLAVFQQWYDANPQGGGAVLPALQNLLATQTPEAVKAAEQIIALVQRREPESPVAAFALAMLRHMTGQKLEAIPLYERVLTLQPENLVAMNNLAWILSQEKGEHVRALELADKGLAQNPDYTDLIDTRGAICFSLGQYEKAAENFKQAVDRYQDLQPEKAVSSFFLAKSLRQLGKNEQALTQFYKARDLDEKSGGLSAEQKVELAEMLK
jgi:predicted Zn-dependent protease